MGINILDYKIVTDFSKCVLNFVFNAEKSSMIDERTLKFLIELKPQEKDVIRDKNAVSIDELGRIDIEIKRVCIEQISEKLTETQNPLINYSPESLELYKNNLKNYLQIIFDNKEIPWLFNHIIETISMQCHEFVFITLYSNRLLNEFDASKAREQKLDSKFNQVLQNVKTMQKNVEDTAQNVKDNLDEVRNKIEVINREKEETIHVTKEAVKATQLAKDASQAAKDAAGDASKKITETSVTVLGMFSGIVITLVAGLFYSSSVLDNINAANFYRLICIAAVVGFVCFHLVALMFRYIDKFRDPEAKSTRLDRLSKIISFIFIILFFFGFSMQFFYPVECDKHSLEAWEEECVATCTDVGLKYRRCQICQKIIETETIPTIPHEYELVIDQQYSCTTNGITHKKCINCGENTDSEIKIATGHNFQRMIDLNPTCTTEGVFHEECSNCGETTTSEIIGAAGHSFKKITDKEPTCTTEGLVHEECVNCSETTTSEIIGATGHSFQKIIDKEPACTTGGMVHEECSNCGETTTPEIIEAVGHYFQQIIDVNPTCTTSGIVHEECLNCGEISNLETVAAMGHTIEIINKDGFAYKKCLICDEIVK